MAKKSSNIPDSVVNLTLDTYKALEQASNEQKTLNNLQEQYAQGQRVINDLKSNYNNLTTEQKDSYDRIVKNQLALGSEIKNSRIESEKHNKSLEIRNRLLAQSISVIKSTFGWMVEQDKIIKSTILSLGVSGQKASDIRTSFEQTAQSAFILGGSLEDISTIMTGFADETGRAKVLSQETLESIIAMGRGTDLGVEGATRLAAQFEFMGVSVQQTSEFVQGIVDTSERMGVNTVKVLKSVNDNFKKLQTFTFTKGSKAFAEMAINAELTRVSMEKVLDVAEASRKLENVIELGAQLQLMGGQFAKMDPFNWLYTVRNEPEKLTEQLSEMTRGLYSIKKTAKGTFESVISPVDADRMRFVAKQLNMTNEELAEIGQRRLALDKISGSLKGMGFTKEQQEWIAGAATLNKTTGEYMIQVGNGQVALQNLTKAQAESTIQEQVTLDKRAKDAMTFNEQLDATINQFKSILLPLLRGVNKVLDSVKPFVDVIAKWANNDVVRGAAMITAASLLLINGVKWLGNTLTATRALFNKGALTTVAASGGSTVVPGGKPLAGAAKQSYSKARTAQTAASGKAFMQKGAGIGIAAVGIGAGIGIAAVGISKLADSMAKLNATQIQALPDVILNLGLAFGAAAIGLGVMAKVASVSTYGLAVISGVALALGASMYMAGTGIGKMSSGLGELASKAKGSGWELAQIGAGIAAINLALFTTGSLGFIGGMLGGFTTLKKVVSTIADKSDKLAVASDVFKNIGVMLSGSKEDLVQITNLVNAISGVNKTKSNVFSDLANLMNKPLKVEFADKSVMLNNDITLNIDGQKLMNKTYSVSVAIKKHELAKHGQGK